MGKEKKHRKKVISVTGYATAKVAPDMVAVTLSLDGFSEGRAEAVACVTGDAAALRKALADQGFEPNSIWDDGLFVYPKYDDDDDPGDAKGNFVGYMCSMNLVACMPLGVDTVGKIMSAMESSETFPVLSLGYVLSDRKGHMADLAAAAVADSRAKADILATAVGMEVEEVLGIFHDSDWESDGYGLYVSHEVARSAAPLVPSPIEIRESVTADWLLD